MMAKTNHERAILELHKLRLRGIKRWDSHITIPKNRQEELDLCWSIRSSFTWKSSPEGHSYWFDLVRALDGMNYHPVHNDE